MDIKTTFQFKTANHHSTDVQSIHDSYGNLTFKSLHIQKNTYGLGEMKSNIFYIKRKISRKRLWKVNHFQLEEKNNI